MRLLLLPACAALLVAPQATAQRIRTAADVDYGTPPLYVAASVAAIAGSIGMTLTNLYVVDPKTSEETKGAVGIGIGLFSIFLAHVAHEAEYDHPTWLQLGAGGVSVLAGIFRLVRADATAFGEEEPPALESRVRLAPWRDSRGGSGLSIHFAF